MSISERHEWQKNNYLVSTDKEKLDLRAIHHYLAGSSWARGISQEIVAVSIKNSLNFGVYHSNEQVGFARLITDYSTFAYLSDVYILEEYQGEGLGRW